MNWASYSLLVICSTAAAQISTPVVSVTSRQAILRYSSPVSDACSLRVADLNRGISIIGVLPTSRTSIVVTTASPHGLLPGAMVYLQGSGSNDGWHSLTAVPAPNQFAFDGQPSAAPVTGTVGVLVDDVNPVLFPGADQDSRPGNTNNGVERVFVIGRRTADVAADGNRYSRALQVNSLHHYSLTCGSQTFEGEFSTANRPLGDTYNEGIPVDRSHPGQYAYPTVQWANRAQALIDPLTGIRSVRVTGPGGTPSSVQSFQTALDATGTWVNANGPLGKSGAASFTGPCNSGNCALLLRADTLSIPGGATYTAAGSSLDWVTVTISGASTSNSACGGDDCKISACLTVDGVDCASGIRQVSLRGSAASYTLGSGGLMDLWQDAGAPPISRVDVSRATGSVSYTAATNSVNLLSGNPFNARWTRGSKITIAGTEYTIDSVQHEASLKLVSGPDNDVTQATYAADNFGVLIWKTSGSADTVTIGQTTFKYGSSAFPAWGALALNACGPAVSVDGKRGYNCFLNTDLYWIADDGSEARNLGTVGTSWWSDGRFSQGGTCGSNSTFQPFDPADGDTWYCLAAIYFDSTRLTLIQGHYRGAHAQYSNGLLPDCALNGGVTPCLDFTILQPNPGDSIKITGPAVNPDFAASGYQPTYWFFGGVSPDGDVMVYAWQGSQDTPGWQFIYSLGDRTPAGTTPNSVRPIAAASTYRRAPLSWCVLHTSIPPEAGWVGAACNDMARGDASNAYVVQVTGAALNVDMGVPGGMNACPENPLGVTGNVCTDLEVSGEPLRVSDGSFLQPSQVGDLIVIDNEYLRIVAKPDSRHFTVQRGYIGAVAAHAGKTLQMTCGVLNQLGSRIGLWNYRQDPTGANIDFQTVVSDAGSTNTHANVGTAAGTGTYIEGGATWYSTGDATCPTQTLTAGANCYIARSGTLGTLTGDPTASAAMIAGDPPFSGAVGIGNPAQIDGHPGACSNGACLDAHPFEGGATPATLIGSPASPFVNVSGQLWKAGGGLSLNRKRLATLAFAGNMPLVDVSGQGSNLQDTAADAYKYCIAMSAGECRANSAPGDVFVNAPHVRFPYCNNPGIAVQNDDNTPICVGDLGLPTGNIVQFGVTKTDFSGASQRNLGPAYSRWNQQNVYWNVQAPPSGATMLSQVRWMEGVRSDDILSNVPPMPAPDGIVRNTFQSVPINVPKPEDPAADNAVVQFGYLENGDPTRFYCTSRQEACLATGSQVNAQSPFFYQLVDSYPGTPCAAGCTIAIPALSERVLYYRWQYRDVNGTVIGSGPMQAMLTP